MEENTKYNLIYPYHLDDSKLAGNLSYDKNYPNSLHCHYFEDVLHAAYLEPYAFYLTDDDKQFYSRQEIEFINKVIEDERKKLDAGNVLVNLELDEETIEKIEMYKIQNNMTFEEAVIDILKKIIENPDDIKSEE
jgi:hypothetical protein